MKAVVKLKKGEGNVELIEHEIPTLGDHEVLVRVKSAGVCGTDIKIWEGHAWSNPPVILGHEFSGVIESVGKNVQRLKVGDRIIAETPQEVCGICEYCRNGRQMMCTSRLSMGYGVDGAFAKYIKVKEVSVHKIPDNLDYDTAALCEPLACAIHAVFDQSELLPTQVVGIWGPGTIGQLVAQVAHASGAKVFLFGTDKDQERLELAKRLGIEETMLVSQENFEECVREKSCGGFHTVFDCSGSLAAINTGLKLLRNMGTLVQVGLTKPQLTIDYAQIPARELKIIGTYGHRSENWDQALKLLADGKVKVNGIITGEYSLEEWEQAFSDMKAQKGIKEMIHPD